MEDIARLAANMVKRDLGIKQVNKKTIFVPEQALVYGEMGYVIDFVPEVGKVYTVSVNGEKYQAEAKSANFQGIDIVVLGNGYIYGLEHTGEDWLIAYSAADQTCAFAWADGLEHDTTISVYQLTETLTPMNPKYLPGVCLPVVELSTIANEYGVEVTAEDAAKLDEVATMNVPIVCKISDSVGSFAAVLTRISNPDVPVGYNAVLSGNDITLIRSDDTVNATWVAIVSSRE